MAKWTMDAVRPVSVGLAIPDVVLTNAQLCETLETSREWIEEKTGILERRVLARDQGISDLAVAAARRALAAAKVEPSSIDVVVVASSTPEWIFPALSVKVAHALGMSATRLVDITQHACSSVVSATYVAGCLLQEADARRALVVCAEGASRVVDPHDRTTRVFFGDAAGAMVLEQTAGPGGLLSYDLGHRYSESVSLAGSPQLRQERDQHGYALTTEHFYMDPGSVLREASTSFPNSIRTTLRHADLAVEDVSGFALHQANVRMLQRIGRGLGAAPEQVAITADTLGNTGAASPMTALWKLASEGRMKKGDVLVVGAIGAGFLWGSMCFRLTDDLLVEE